MIPVYGDKCRKGECNSEAAEHKDFFGWLKEFRPNLHAVAIHPKNEGRRTWQQASRDRALGALNTGAVDIIIPVRVAFVCELKARHGGKLSENQKAYLLAAQSLGAFACVALGREGAVLAILDWEIKNKSEICCNNCIAIL